MWAFILFIFLAVAQAAELGVSAIETAQALALKKKRQEAIHVLVKAIEASPSTGKARSRLMESLDSISKMFFSDKGQKLFEAAQSSMYEAPDMALSQFREALTLEDGNQEILTNVARIQIQKADCTSALQTLQSIRLQNPISSDPAVLELRTLVCLKNFEQFREKQKLLPSLSKSQEILVDTLVAQELMQQKLWRKANEILIKVSEGDSHFPETYFYLSRVSAELGRDNETWSEKYVTLCKGVNARVRKTYSLEPRLCANVKEVEDELASKASDL